MNRDVSDSDREEVMATTSRVEMGVLLLSEVLLRLGLASFPDFGNELVKLFLI